MRTTVYRCDNMKCEKCGTKLITLYHRKWDTNKKNSYFVKIKQMYCRNCEIPTEVNVMNWFNGE